MNVAKNKYIKYLRLNRKVLSIISNISIFHSLFISIKSNYIKFLIFN